MRDSEDLRNPGGRREQMYCSRGTATQMDRLTEMAAAAYHNAQCDAPGEKGLCVGCRAGGGQPPWCDAAVGE